MKQWAMLTAVTLCLGILNSCGAARPSRFYQLTVPSDKGSGTDPPPYPISLILGRITTSHLYRDDHIVYTSTGEAMGTYEYQRWVEPAPEMINDVLLRELQRSGRYAHVYFLRSDVRGDYLLTGHLYDFREVDGSRLAARVAFDFDLRELKTGATVWSHSYSNDEPVNGKDISAVVAAMNRNVQSGLSEILDRLNQYWRSCLLFLSTTFHSPCREM